jgi:hypothetical protein
LASRIINNTKYFLYFNNCLGVLDNIYISVYIPLEEQSRYRNRKGTLSQNVLAVCNFDMSFVYILPGWEGSAYNRRVLSDTQSRYGFDMPKGKYWLGDTGYRNSKYIIALYRSVRYYLKEQRQADLQPNTARELFNLYYTSLRNIIEYIFGVVKRKFKILGSGAEYSIDTQIHLVLGLVGLYNFICLHEDIQDDEINKEVLEDNSDIEYLRKSISSSAIDKRRDKLVQDM